MEQSKNKKIGILLAIIDIAVLIVSGLCIIGLFPDIKMFYTDLCSGEYVYIITIFCIAFFVHLFKSSRLLFILYGSVEINVCDFIRLYSKTTPVNILLPYKLGEIYRIFAYGGYLNDFLSGIIIIVLDRFFDTLALIFIVLVSYILFGAQVSFIAYFLMFFLFMIILCYLSFPRFYKFWNKKLIKSKESENTIKLLQLLSNINVIYKNVDRVFKGKWLILFILSFMAWSVELLGLVITNKGISENTVFAKTLIEYLSSIMGGIHSKYQVDFVISSNVILLISYLITRVIMIKRKTV